MKINNGWPFQSLICFDRNSSCIKLFSVLERLIELCLRDYK